MENKLNEYFESGLIEKTTWDLFQSKKEKLQEKEKNEEIKNLGNFLRSKDYLDYHEFVTMNKLKTKKKTKKPKKKVQEKTVFAEIEIEFTTQTEQFHQGTFVVESPFLEIGIGGKGERDDNNYLDLGKYMDFRPDTAKYIEKKHATLLFDESNKDFTLINHSKNGILVNYILVLSEPYKLKKDKQITEVRIGNVFLNYNPPTFDLLSINLKIKRKA